MAMIKQLDKRSGITYVYESTSYWDRDKKQPRSKRTLIGRLDPDSGEVVPTDGRGKRRSIKSLNPPAKRGPIPVTQTAFCGAQRTPMRFRADAMRNITDAPKRLILLFSSSVGSLLCSALLPA